MNESKINLNGSYDYDKSIQSAINRRSIIEIKNKRIVTQREYTIGRNKYIVNSFFDMTDRTVEDGIKRLLDFNIDKAS